MWQCRDISQGGWDWENLINMSQTASFFQTGEWLRLWKRHFLKKKKEKIIGIFEDNKLVGIAPLVITGKKINFLGVEPVLEKEFVTDFGDIIALSGKEREIWQTLLRIFPSFVFSLRFIREDSPSFSLLKDLGGKTQKVEEAPYLDLPATWEEYLNSLARHHRHELKRKIRRLEKAGHFLITEKKGHFALEEFFRLMSLSDKEKRNFLSSVMKNFFADIFQTFESQKKAKIYFLKFQGENIAAAFLFYFKNEVLLYNSGFNPQYSHLAPGLLLKALVIKKAIEEGKKRFEFLQGGESYKYHLGGRKRNLYEIILARDKW